MDKQITQNIYNGKEWIKVISEPVYNKDGTFTGHFKEVEREYVNQFGIFDDIEIYNNTIRDINSFKNKNVDTMYLAQGSGFIKIFSTYAIIPEYENLGTAFLKFIEDTGLIPEKYSNTGSSIIMDVYDRKTLKKSQIILTKGTKYVSTIR